MVAGALVAACAGQGDVVQGGVGTAVTAAVETASTRRSSPPFPGIGELTGARVLAEIGDDRNRSSAAIFTSKPLAADANGATGSGTALSTSDTDDPLR